MAPRTLQAVLLAVCLCVIAPTAASAHDSHAGEQSWCADPQVAAEAVEAQHRENLARLKDKGSEPVKAPAANRISQGLYILEDDGRMIAFGKTDMKVIINRALAFIPDRYDFIAVYTASSFEGDIAPEAGFFAYAYEINGHVHGVNRGPWADPDHPYVRTVLNMNDLDSYPPHPTGIAVNGVASGVEVLAHEVGHAFGAYVYAEPADLIGRGEAHWSYYLQSHGSVLQGNKWIDNGDGSFTTAPAAEQFAVFSQLDQYLMGLRSVDELTDPIWVITQPFGGPAHTQFPQGSQTVSGTRVDILPSQIASYNTARDPGYGNAPTEFSIAFALIVPQGANPPPGDVQFLHELQAEFAPYFTAATDGRAVMHVGIDDPVPVSAYFRPDRRVGAAPCNVTFDNLTRGHASSYVWDFGDGQTSTDFEPTHTYEENGTYTVTLTVEGVGGPVSYVSAEPIIVDEFETILFDDFETDQGWELSLPQDARPVTRFARAAPEPTGLLVAPIQPGYDATPDPGTLAWVTGPLAGATPNDYDLDNGTTTVISPPIDILPFGQIYLSYARWYSNNKGSNNHGDDVLRFEVSADDGATWVELERIGESLTQYRRRQFLLDGLVPASATFRFRVLAADLGEATVVEAVFDDFEMIGVRLPDADGDGFPDDRDTCPELADPDQADGDLDGRGDPCDCEPADPAIYEGAPEVCDGLDNDCDGELGPDEIDTDQDGTLDCADGCPEHPDQIDPGACGCGEPETDSDGDGVPDCIDGCPDDPAKDDPQSCGCGLEETDGDGDGVADCVDECPEDPLKGEAGQCGCGFEETDGDGDGVADCVDECPEDPLKGAAGQCGCGEPDTDTDGDQVADCVDQCPDDPGKTEPGICGCGNADTDTDGDQTPDCNDACPEDPDKLEPGICGCGTADVDSDGDEMPDCNDGCPDDPDKFAPGACSCGVADDADGDGVLSCEGDCNDLDPEVWRLPGDVELLELTFDTWTAVTALAWSPVAEPGGLAVVYDVIRSSEAEDFSLATCVESGDGSDLVAEDPTLPQPNQVHYFLVRAANACPAGDGSVGQGNNGLARSAKECP